MQVPRLYEGFVRVDEQGRTFLVDPLKNGGQKHTFLFKYADGKILLDDEDMGAGGGQFRGKN